METGTFLGETTEVLAANAQFVYSLEPEPVLYARAVGKFRRYRNVSIINATSEQSFPTLLPQLSGVVNFWLDGHYCAGVTYKGQKDTPIVEELEQIELNLGRFSQASVLVDDIRCFNPSIADFAAYPPLDFLVDWARRNSLVWHIEHDIFVARKLTGAK